jgi:alkylhydroperoxidase family enzyme
MRTLRPVPADIAEPAELVAAIRLRRGGTLFNLDRMLLHSPPFARGWNTFMGAVRTELSLAPKLSELAICVVAVLNEAEYEFGHHAPLYQRAGGSAAQVAALRDPHSASANPAFDPLEQAVIRLTISMTREIKVPPAILADLHAQLPAEQQRVELIGTIAAYNMVSRFLVATGVEPE